MAKIEFSAQELELIKEAAEAYKDGGKEKAKAVLDGSNFTLELSPAVKEMAAPDMAAENSSDGCYACFACVITAAMVNLNWLT